MNEIKVIEISQTVEKKYSMKYKILLLVLFLISYFNLSSQEKLVDKYKFGAFIAGDLSNTGYYGCVGVSVSYMRFSLSLSQIINFHETSFPFNGPIGFNSSLSYFPSISPNKKVNMYLNLDYKIIYNNKNTINELGYGYGMMVNIWKNIYFCNNINAGFFSEKLYSKRSGDYITNYGFNILIKTSIHIRF